VIAVGRIVFTDVAPTVDVSVIGFTDEEIEVESIKIRVFINDTERRLN
jgi:hypothetical protein